MTAPSTVGTATPAAATSAARGRRVVLFDPYPHLQGGGQKVTRVLCTQLRHAGVAATLLTTGPGPAADAAAADGVPVAILSPTGPLSHYGHRLAGPGAVLAGPALVRYWVGTARWLRRHHVDLVHAVDLRGLILVGPAARLAGSQVVWHVHSSEPRPRLNRLAARLAHRVIVPSARVEGDLDGLDAARIRVVPNSVDPAALAAVRASPARARLVCAARLAPVKGLDVLFDAMHQLLGRWPGLHLDIYGAGQPGAEDHEAALRAAAAAPPLAGHVTFHGHVASPVTTWSDATVYVQPSRFEALPLAVLEAMAAGLPVVACDVGGVGELVGHGVTGLLVPADEPAALATALGVVLGDRHLAAVMGRAGRAVVAGRLSPGDMARRVAAVYDEVLS